MIFKQAQQVLNGTKTQTRRPVKPSEILRYASSNGRFSYLRDEEFSIATVIMWAGDYIRIKWQVGKTYAVQPGRGKKSIGRIRITKIRRERLEAISTRDCFQEGITQHLGNYRDYRFSYPSLDGTLASARGAFCHLWNSLYRKPYTWKHNPEVWVLEFKEVQA